MTTSSPIRIDIVSDVVCPWCIVGYRQLSIASENTGIPIDVHFHPFQLNPQIPPEGQNLREHLAGKYGTTEEQSRENRERLKALGESLGFAFDFSEGFRTWNTFCAHCLLDWAETEGRQVDMKLALFRAYFIDHRNISDEDTLVGIAAGMNLPAEDARAALTDPVVAQRVREKMQFWTSRGVSSVPSMVFDSRLFAAGARGVDTYADVLRQCVESSLNEASETPRTS